MTTQAGRENAFRRLAKSKFRSRFHLSADDRQYIAEKGRFYPDSSRSGDTAKRRPANADARPPRIPRPTCLRLLLPRLHGEVVESSEGNAHPARATSANC